MSELKDTIRDLTLILIYLTAWREGKPPSDVLRAWKGYDFDILNRLTEEGLIDGSKSAKSTYLTEEGEKTAKELLSKYGIGQDTI